MGGKNLEYFFCGKNLYQRNPSILVGIKMEVTVGEKGRVTLPFEIRKALGIREGDVITIEPRGKEIVLRPKRYVSVRDVEGAAALGKVKIKEIEEALGKE